MADAKSGADFMLGDIGLKKKPAPRIHGSGELDIDAAVQSADAADASTPKNDKSAYDARAGGELYKTASAASAHPPVQIVLEGPFRLSEYTPRAGPARGASRCGGSDCSSEGS